MIADDEDDESYFHSNTLIFASHEVASKTTFIKYNTKSIPPYNTLIENDFFGQDFHTSNVSNTYSEGLRIVP